MYHPSRGGVRGGRDQFTWEDVKVDKHRENYLGHSIKAPVGRWQKGKDLHWYNRDKKSNALDSEVLKEEICRIKEEEEQAMREALGLAPKRSTQVRGNRLDKHEFSELIKRGSTAEDVGAGHAEAARVHGLGFSKMPCPWEESSVPSSSNTEPLEKLDGMIPDGCAPARNDEVLEEENTGKKRKHEERKREKHEERKREKHEKREKRHSRDSDERRKHKRDKERRRHDSD